MLFNAIKSSDFKQRNSVDQLPFKGNEKTGKELKELREIADILSNPRKEDCVNLDWIDDSTVKDIIIRVLSKDLPELSKNELVAVLKYFGYEDTGDAGNGHGTKFRPIGYKDKGIRYTVRLQDAKVDSAATQHLKSALRLVNYTHGEIIYQPENKQTIKPEDIVAFNAIVKEFNQKGQNRYRAHLENKIDKEEKTKKQNERELNQKQNIQLFTNIALQRVELIDITKTITSLDQELSKIKDDYRVAVEFLGAENLNNNKDKEVENKIIKIEESIAQAEKAANEYQLALNSGKEADSEDVENLKIKISDIFYVLKETKDLIEEISDQILEINDMKVNFADNINSLYEKIVDSIAIFEHSIEKYQKDYDNNSFVKVESKIEQQMQDAIAKARKELSKIKSQVEEISVLDREAILDEYKAQLKYIEELDGKLAISYEEFISTMNEIDKELIILQEIDKKRRSDRLERFKKRAEAAQKNTIETKNIETEKSQEAELSNAKQKESIQKILNMQKAYIELKVVIDSYSTATENSNYKNIQDKLNEISNLEFIKNTNSMQNIVNSDILNLSDEQLESKINEVLTQLKELRIQWNIFTGAYQRAQEDLFEKPKSETTINYSKPINKQVIIYNLNDIKQTKLRQAPEFRIYDNKITTYTKLKEPKENEEKIKFSCLLAMKISLLPIDKPQEAIAKLVLAEVKKANIETYKKDPNASTIFRNRIVNKVMQHREYNNIQQAVRFAFLNYIFQNSTNLDGNIYNLNSSEAKELYSKLTNGQTNVQISIGGKITEVNLEVPMKVDEISKQFEKYNTKMEESLQVDLVCEKLMKYGDLNSCEDKEKVKAVLKKQGSYFELLLDDSSCVQLKKILIELFWKNYDEDNGTNKLEEVTKKLEEEQQELSNKAQQSKTIELFESIDWQI